jgi:hypothetical protein
MDTGDFEMGSPAQVPQPPVKTRTRLAQHDFLIPIYKVIPFNSVLTQEGYKLDPFTIRLVHLLHHVCVG